MKDERHGESLWEEWQGNNYDQRVVSSVIYYTLEHVDIEHELVRRALASALQRDGVAYSLADGFSLIDKTYAVHGWLGVLDGENEYTVCDEYGETEYADLVDSIYPATWIEI